MNNPIGQSTHPPTHPPTHPFQRGVPWCNWSKFPIFFSIAMSCYEGIGTVLPVESSMHSPREAYAPLLHLALAFTTLFLGSFGAVGLLRFYGTTTSNDDGGGGGGGTDINNDHDDDHGGVEQIATENLPVDALISALVRGCLVVAILCTYPLQLFPVIQVCERWALRYRQWRHQRQRQQQRRGGREGSGEALPAPPQRNMIRLPRVLVRCCLGEDLIEEDEDGDGDEGRERAATEGQAVHANDYGHAPSPVAPHTSSSSASASTPVSSSSSSSSHCMVWVDAVRIYGPSAGASLGETLALRGGLVVLTSVVAVVAGDFYGYIASLVGALGATTLSFIMPSLMHLRLFGGASSSSSSSSRNSGRASRNGGRSLEKRSSGYMYSGGGGGASLLEEERGEAEERGERQQQPARLLAPLHGDGDSEKGGATQEPMSALTKFKDVATIAVGVASGVAGLVVTARSWADEVDQRRR
jgi:hypothetical protein